MAKKFRNKYRIESTRMQYWDYAWRGNYFITICTHDRERYFGYVKNQKMILSEIGEIAIAEWLKSPEIRPDMNLEMDEFIIMPDHLHGIIKIGRNKYNDYGYWNNMDLMNSRDAMHGVSTGNSNGISKKQPGPQRKNISSIIRGFKSAVTIKARQIHADFRWQPRFHEKLIRDERALNNIRRYIRNNPRKWVEDK